MAMQSSPIKC